MEPSTGGAAAPTKRRSADDPSNILRTLLIQSAQLFRICICYVWNLPCQPRRTKRGLEPAAQRVGAGARTQKEGPGDRRTPLSSYCSCAPYSPRARYGVPPPDGAGGAPPGAGNSTVGTSRAAPLVTSKYFRACAPVTFAVITAGKVRMYELYDRTDSL